MKIIIFFNGEITSFEYSEGLRANEIIKIDLTSSVIITL